MKNKFPSQINPQRQLSKFSFGVGWGWGGYNFINLKLFIMDLYNNQIKISPKFAPQRRIYPQRQLSSFDWGGGGFITFLPKNYLLGMYNKNLIQISPTLPHTERKIISVPLYPAKIRNKKTIKVSLGGGVITFDQKLFFLDSSLQQDFIHCKKNIFTGPKKNLKPKYFS